MAEMTRYLATELARVGDPARAAAMAQYMKSDMPFYGVPKPERTEIYREMRKRFPITTRAGYQTAVRALWAQPYREEKYCAIRLAVDHPRYVTIGTVPLYRQMIIEGGWWDFVDDIAARLVGKVLLDDRARMHPKLDRWIDDPNMWIRRTAILSQLKHKAATDQDQLFGYCLKRADEKEFFIRKAIGWALREYAKTEPDGVRAFALEHRERLSGLSFREATKHLL
jgi:3-methyladenine DNA glycosylase AlkD